MNLFLIFDVNRYQNLMKENLATHNFSNYFKQYINLVNNEYDVVSALEITHQQTNKLLGSITEEQGNYAYATGKWSIKELLVHLIDTERIFCNRALRFARNDNTDLPGYDHDAYVPFSGANKRTLHEICEEFNAVRAASIALFNSFTSEMLAKEGTANGNALTVLAIGFILSGHEIHHTKVLQEKYL